MTPATLSHLENQLGRAGFVVIEGALHRRQVAEMRAFLVDALVRHRELPTPTDGILTNSPLYQAIWPDFYQVHPEWFRLFCTDQVVRALHALLGEPFVMTRDSIVHWDYFPGWHTDTTTTETRGELSHLEPDWRMLTVGTYLQQGGGLEVVPGSHRDRDPFVAIRQKHSVGGQPKPRMEWSSVSSFEIPLAAGDVVIFDMRLVHRAATSVPRDQNGRPCEKIALFSRVSRNIASHVAAYSDFRFNGAGAREDGMPLLRAMASSAGFILA